MVRMISIFIIALLSLHCLCCLTSERNINGLTGFNKISSNLISIGNKNSILYNILNRATINNNNNNYSVSNNNSSNMGNTNNNSSNIVNTNNNSNNNNIYNPSLS